MTIDRWNAWAAAWAGWMARGLVESTILFVLVAAVAWFGRNRLTSGAIQGLFLLVLIKLVLPLPVAIRADWLGAAPRIPPVERIAVKAGGIEALADVVPGAVGTKFPPASIPAEAPVPAALTASPTPSTRPSGWRTG